MLQATLDASAGNVNAKLVEAAHQMTETIASLEDRCEVLEKMVVGEWISWHAACMAPQSLRTLPPSPSASPHNSSEN